MKSTEKRPLAITIIGSLLMLLGTALLFALIFTPPDPGQSQRIAEFQSQHPLQYDVEQYVPLKAVQCFTILCGLLIFLGFNVGRYLFLLWIAYHLFTGFLNSPANLIIHGILFSTVLYFLFNKRATVYFKNIPRST